jgi:hypothetical protein
MPDAPLHPVATFWLGVLDEIIKLAAVFIGAWWTLWNFRKSRTYQQKLELEIVGTVFIKNDLYGDVLVTAKNIGSARHIVQKGGSFIEISVILDDLSEHIVELFQAFTNDTSIEPGESITDTRFWSIAPPVDNIVWVRLGLRFTSEELEWKSSSLIRVVRQPDNTSNTNDGHEEELS